MSARRQWIKRSLIAAAVLLALSLFVALYA